MKAKLCKLLMKLYIDQEPRRTQILPELCKVVRVSEQEVLGGISFILNIKVVNKKKKITFSLNLASYFFSKGNEDLANELFTAKEEQAIIQRIITTINGYIEKMVNYHKKLKIFIKNNYANNELKNLIEK